MAYNDLGKTIGEIVEQAINSKEFKELNKTINSSLVIALDEVQKNLNKAKRYRGAKEDRIKYTSENNELFKNVSIYKIIGILLMILGVPCTFFCGITALAGIFLLGIYGFIEVFTAATCIAATLFFGWLTIKGYKILAKANRFESYIKALKMKPLASIKDLSQAVNKSVAFVKKEVEEMIKKDWFRQGHLDEYKRYLFVDDESFETLHQGKVYEKEEKQEVKQETTIEDEHSEVIKQGQAYVQELKRLNINIINHNVSTSIDHIEVTTSKIFEYVSKHPENIKDIRKFMKYYLPMTIKLLKAYEELEQQPISGENIENSKDEIEDTLKSLDYAFMKILDDLFMNTAMDVSSDATVLENMLRQDGLSENKLKM